MEKNIFQTRRGSAWRAWRGRLFGLLAALCVCLGAARPGPAGDLGLTAAEFTAAFNSLPHASQLGLSIPAVPYSDEERGLYRIRTYLIGPNMLLALQMSRTRDQLDMIRFMAGWDRTPEGELRAHGGALLVFQALTPSLTPAQRLPHVEALHLDSLHSIRAKPGTTTVDGRKVIAWTDEDGLWLSVEED